MAYSDESAAEMDRVRESLAAKAAGAHTDTSGNDAFANSSGEAGRDSLMEKAGYTGDPDKFRQSQASARQSSGGDFTSRPGGSSGLNADGLNTSGHGATGDLTGIPVAKSPDGQAADAADARSEAAQNAADARNESGFGHGTKVAGGVHKGYTDTAGNPASPFYTPGGERGRGGGRAEPQGGTVSHSLTVGAPAKPVPVKTAEAPSSAVSVDRAGSGRSGGGGGSSGGGGASAGGGGGGGSGGGSSGGGAPPSGKPSELLQSSWQLIFQVPGAPITLCDFDDILDGPVTFIPSRNSQSEQFVGSTTGAVYDRGNKMTEIHFERWVMFDTVEEALNSVLLTSVQIPNGSWPLTITVQGQSVFTVANCVIVSYPSTIWNNLCRTSYTLRGGELTEGAIITAEDGTELTTEDGSTLITES